MIQAANKHDLQSKLDERVDTCLYIDKSLVRGNSKEGVGSDVCDYPSTILTLSNGFCANNSDSSISWAVAAFHVDPQKISAHFGCS